MAELRTRIILRNDSTANWLTNENVVLLKGEVGIEFLANGKVKMKVGDGTKTWAQLSYFGGEDAHVYEATVAKGGDHIAAITTAVNGAEPNTHDVAIVKEAIVAEDDLKEGVEQKYQYTAYRYNGTAWAAMDGNYSAENVYFTEDFIFTNKIGTVQTLTNGSATVAAAGKSIKDFFAGLFAAEQNPSKTDPSVGITLKTVKDSSNNYIYSFEVGTKLTPSYTATFEDGKYSYGPEPTGAAVESWEVTSTHGEDWDTASGTCEELTVGDDTNYSVTAKATHSAGNTPKTNIGNDCTDSSKKIAAGTKSKTSSAITGYRSYFYGVLDNTDAFTSGMIRGLTNGGAYTGSTTLTVKVNGNTSAKRIVVAIPASSTRSGITKVMKTDGLATEITASYTETKNAVSVEGVDGYTAASYNVWVYQPASIDAAEVHEITLG